MIYIRKDQVAYLKSIGLERYIIGKTCHGKKYVEEAAEVKRALKAYEKRIMEG